MFIGQLCQPTFPSKMFQMRYENGYASVEKFVIIRAMDIIAHGLWTGAVYKTANFKTKKPFRVWWAVFWGTAPDIFHSPRRLFG